MIATRCGRAIRSLGILIAAVASVPTVAQNPPLKKDSVRFAIIGDMGTGEKAQYEVAWQMERSRQTTGFDFVPMPGDNIYGGKSAADMKRDGVFRARQQLHGSAGKWNG